MSETDTTAADGAAEETTMAKKSKKAKLAKTAKPKAVKAKASKPKREKPTGPKPSRTFAIRITGEELEAIHKAAGPRNATRFIRLVAAAFAQADSKAFARILEEAAQNRG